MSKSTYEEVTKRIIAALADGVVPWQKPWHMTSPPVNAVSKRPYRGVNMILLGITPYTDNRWLTFRQAKEMGGHVKRGQESALVVFWKRWEVKEVEQTEEHKSRTIPLLRFYHVFNAEQCEGLSLEHQNSSKLSESDRIILAEETVRQMPRPPRILERGDRAFYRPSEDLVQVPPLSAFQSADAFYATLFHELGHATGHASRLERAGVTGEVQFGSLTYSREELVAELASAFCCSTLSLDNTQLNQSASYIQGWLKALKDDPKALTIAAAQAQRAADYIRGLMEGPDEILYPCVT